MRNESVPIQNFIRLQNNDFNSNALICLSGDNAVKDNPYVLNVLL
jgi:hypothetical protein